MNHTSHVTIQNARSIVALVLCLLALAGCDLGPSGGQATQTPTLPVQTHPTQTTEATVTAPPTDTQVPAAAQAPTDTAVPATNTPVAVTDTPVPLAPTIAPTRVEPSPTRHIPATATEIPTRRPQTPATSTPVPAAHTPTRVPAAPTSTPVLVRTQSPATSTPAVSQNLQIQLIANGYGSPDDLFVAPDGEILFGDFGNNALNGIRPGEAPHVIAGGFNEPEGITIAKDGAIIVAEQGTNRIIEVDPQTGQKKVLRQLVNRTGQDGADGVSLDPNTGDILIPDSPNGRILRMSRDGSTLTTIATGFVRPTGVAVEPGGTMVVADEFGNAVYRLRANGTKVKLAGIFQPDDIIVGPDGSIYANSLGGDIVKIDPSSGAKRVLASGLKLPHGLGMDPSGNLVIAESGRNRIFRLK